MKLEIEGSCLRGHRVDLDPLVLVVQLGDHLSQGVGQEKDITVQDQGIHIVFLAEVLLGIPPESKSPPVTLQIFRLICLKPERI